MNNSDAWNEDAAKFYFLGLFTHSLDTVYLNNLWQSINTTLLSPQEKINWAVEAAVAVIERNVLKDRENEDVLLASNMIKADRRREAKKRNKDRKRSMKTMEEFSTTKLGKSLSSEEMSAFMTVKEILGNTFFRHTPETIVSVLLKFNYDINLSIDQLLINDDSKEQPNTGTTLLVQDIPIMKVSSVQDHNESNLPTMRSRTATDVALLSMQPLLDHFIRHLQSRNPGIIAQWEDDCMIYKGIREGLRLTSNPCELTVSIDLHGQTRKPAVDILQSSILYYHNMLLAGRFNPCILEAATSDLIYSGSNKKVGTTTGNNSKHPKYLDIKSILIIYVVGQGIHSVGAVPVLRNTFMRELQEFWSVFDYGIDTENSGSVYVRVKRLR